jgi:hypothetical protein
MVGNTEMSDIGKVFFVKSLKLRLRSLRFKNVFGENLRFAFCALGFQIAFRTGQPEQDRQDRTAMRVK